MPNNPVLAVLNDEPLPGDEPSTSRARRASSWNLDTWPEDGDIREDDDDEIVPRGSPSRRGRPLGSRDTARLEQRSISDRHSCMCFTQQVCLRPLAVH
jgi:hypothetical protein